MKIKSVLTLLSFLFVMSVANAESISPAMIQQLQSLPLSQQKALAQQYGVDLDAIATTSSPDSKRLAQPGTELSPPEKKTDERVGEGEIESTKTVPSKSSSTDTVSIADSAVANVVDQELSPEVVEQNKQAPLARFGRSIFDTQVSTFAPTDNAQVPSNYVVGIGDELIVQLFGKDNSTFNLMVGRDGMVNFPKLGAISVTGLSFDDAKAMIKTRVDEQLIGVTALVSMGQLRAMNIFMAGEVAVPGAYSVSALTTITQALFQAGGVTEIGSLRNIQVRRNGELITSFDLYDLLLEGDISGDLRLQSGDVVFVPPYDSLITMTGEIKRPAVYEVLKGETLGQLIKMAGGYKSSAYAGELVVLKKRNAGELPEALNISAADSPDLDLIMGNGDVVRVLPLGDNVQRLVTLEGALARPGVYGWAEGIRVSDLVSDVRRDLLADADLSYSIIVREKNANLDVDVINFSLAEAITGPYSDKDPILFPRDKVLVFSLPDVTDLNNDMSSSGIKNSTNSREKLLGPVITKLRIQAKASQRSNFVKVEGSVKAAGNYPLTKNLTLSELLKAAGGLDDNAYVETAMVQRVVDFEKGVSEFTNYEVPFSDFGTFNLKPRDTITIDQRIEWNPNQIELLGAIKRPGNMPWREGLRVSDLIKDIRRDLNDTADINYSLIVREQRNTLNIATVQFSLLDALSKKGSEYDPMLSPRDKIIVFDWSGADPNSPNSRRTLLKPILDRISASASASASASNSLLIASISGGVKFGGSYPISRTSSIADLVSAAGGFSESAAIESIEIRRNTINEIGINELSLIEVPKDKYSTTLLGSRDHITVRQRANWNPDDKIQVSGEVLYPGEYYLLPDETLKDILKRAGGLTNRASVEGAVFTRQSIADQERFQANRFAQEIERDFAASLLTQEESKGDFSTIESITSSLKDYAGFGRIVIDLKSALLGDPASNIELEGGDSLYIPPQSNAVSILGEVRRSGSLTFEKGLQVEDYLDLAAGTTARADLEGIYVVKSSGEVVIPKSSWTQFTRSTIKVSPGDTIVVPVNSQYKDSIPFWRDITQIIYQGTVTIAAAMRL
jgi:polysaccharide export outer membrane protein